MTRFIMHFILLFFVLANAARINENKLIFAMVCLAVALAYIETTLWAVKYLRRHIPTYKATEVPADAGEGN